MKKIFSGVLLALALTGMAAEQYSWRKSQEGSGEIKGGTLLIPGDGKFNNYFLSQPQIFQGGKCYQLDYQYKCSRVTEGAILAGPLFCNRNVRTYSQWRDESILFTAPESNFWRELRFGQWGVDAKVEFRNIRYYEIFPVYSERDGITLDEKEKLSGNTYCFDADFPCPAGTIARTISKFDCGFNSNRLLFQGGREIIFRHRLDDRQLTKAELSGAVDYCSTGDLQLFVGKDLNNLKLLKDLKEVGKFRFAIPEECLPAKEIFVKFSCKTPPQKDEITEFYPGTIQIKNYMFTAEFDGEPQERRGVTAFGKVVREDKDLQLTVLNGGAMRPDGANQIVCEVKNPSKTAKLLVPTLDLSNGGKKQSFRLAPVELAPGEQRILRIPYALKDGGNNMLALSFGDNSTYLAEIKIYLPYYFDESYGEILQNDSTAAVWSAPAEWKVPPKRALPEKCGSGIKISAAREEHEGTQIVITPKHGIKSLAVEVSPLRNGKDELPASTITVLKEIYVNVARRTDETTVRGLWPDPMPEFKAGTAVPPGQNLVLWLDAKIPAQAKAGNYQGTVTLKDLKGRWQCAVPLTVTVYDFNLPKNMTCRSAINCIYEDTWPYLKPSNTKEKQIIDDTYMQALAEHRLSPYVWGSETDIPASLKDGHVVFDWKKWDEDLLAKQKKYNFNSFRLLVNTLGAGCGEYNANGKIFGHNAGTPEYDRLNTEYLQGIGEHFKNSPLAKYAYIYWYDEPLRKNYGFVRNGFEKLRKYVPNVPGLLTEQVDDDLAGAPAIWCTHTMFYDEEIANRARARGERLWWYLCCFPKENYCTLFIDHPGHELRTWLWQTWKHDIDGILIWQTTCWHGPTVYKDCLQNPYKDTMSWSWWTILPDGSPSPWGNGDGRLFYPPEIAAEGKQPGFVADKPVTSIRMELLRDGVEDYEYFAMLKRLLAEKGGELTVKERENYAKLLQVPESVTKSMMEFSADSQHMHLHREKLARAIEELSKR